MVPLPKGRGPVASQLEAAWARAAVVCLRAASEGGVLSFPFIYSSDGCELGLRAVAARGQPGSRVCSERGWSTSLSEEQETSSGLGAGRAETPQ